MTPKPDSIEDNDINRWIAEKVMGLCWHDFRRCGDSQEHRCFKCNAYSMVGKNPAYDSPDSPRSLLDAVEAKVDPFAYGRALLEAVLAGEADACELTEEEVAFRVATASPDKRCEAIKKTWEEAIYEQGEKE